MSTISNAFSNHGDMRMYRRYYIPKVPNVDSAREAMALCPKVGSKWDLAWAYPDPEVIDLAAFVCLNVTATELMGGQFAYEVVCEYGPPTDETKPETWRDRPPLL